jgi:2-isopropylmalate synthase
MRINSKYFRVVSFRVIVEDSFLGKVRSLSEASVKVVITKSGKRIEIYEVADGIGPVNALDKALRKAVGSHYSCVDKVKLVDYQVYRRKGNTGTASEVKVIVVSSDGKRFWSTKGISTDVIRASFVAIVKSLKQELQKTVQ